MYVDVLPGLESAACCLGSSSVAWVPLSAALVRRLLLLGFHGLLLGSVVCRLGSVVCRLG